MVRKIRIAAAVLLLAGLGTTSTGCSHTNVSPGAAAPQPGSVAQTKTLPNGSAPPPDSPALEAAKKRFGNQQQ